MLARKNQKIRKILNEVLEERINISPPTLHCLTGLGGRSRKQGGKGQTTPTLSAISPSVHADDNEPHSYHSAPGCSFTFQTFGSVRLSEPMSFIEIYIT